MHFNIEVYSLFRTFPRVTVVFTIIVSQILSFACVVLQLLLFIIAQHSKMNQRPVMLPWLVFILPCAARPTNSLTLYIIHHKVDDNFNFITFVFGRS